MKTKMLTMCCTLAILLTGMAGSPHEAMSRGEYFSIGGSPGGFSVEYSTYGHYAPPPPPPPREYGYSGRDRWGRPVVSSTTTYTTYSVAPAPFPTYGWYPPPRHHHYYPPPHSHHRPYGHWRHSRW